MSQPESEPGILRPQLSAEHFDYRRHEPDPLFAHWVENFWTITWDLPPGATYLAQVLSYPSVNVSVTNTECDVTGLARRRYDRRLVGRGYVVGARFRPGCFRPLIDFPVSELTDRHRPIATVLGRDPVELDRGVAATDDPEQRVQLLRGFLAASLPARDETAGRLADLVHEISQDRELTRVDQVADRVGWGVRRLQRLFSDYVGAAPKWVIQRCRLQDAAARAAAAEPVDWAGLAVELGFADQAHLTRAFTATIGTSPAAYAAEARRR
ncbi:MAG TPA: helix-turn-helix domain-containing protein [Propionibacteriaceae bacterium]